MVISLGLLIASILYSIFNDRDPYKYHTGLGSELAISPNDEKLAFSYYLDGNEAIYTANPDGTEITKISKEDEGRVHTPRFSFDGKKVAYLKENSEGIQSLMIMDADGSNSELLTEESLHVSDAVFSPESDTIYYIAIPAEDYKKAEGETKEGYDLFAVNMNGKEGKQLTNIDHFTMNNLSISNDGKQLFYSLYETKEELYAFTISEKKELKVEAAAGISDDMYSAVFSQDKKLLAYTAVSEESKNSSLFEYELFIRDIETNETNQITHLKKNIQSPVFLHQTNNIAFLEYKNWPGDPEQYQLMTVSIDGGKPVLIDLELPTSEENNWFIKTIDFVLSDIAIAVYYVLLLGGVTVYLQRNSGKVFLPSYISIGLAVLIFISSFVISAITNPWFGIALAMVALTVFICSLILLAFAFIVKRIVKPF
jgi:Tol biopolymer transport system component